MSDVPDLSLLKTLEQMGPWIASAAAALSAVVGWIANWIMKQFRSLSSRLDQLESVIPEKYAKKSDVEHAVVDVGKTLQLHVDTIRTDVSRIERAMIETQTDIKEVLKMFIKDQK